MFLPAYRSTGFFSFGGRGWKIFWISILLLGAGAVLAMKEPGEKALLLFLPGLLNLATAALLVVGLASVRGPAVQMLGGIALLGWLGLFALLLTRSRGDLQLGSLFWSIACGALSLHAILA